MIPSSRVSSRPTARWARTPTRRSARCSRAFREVAVHASASGKQRQKNSSDGAEGDRCEGGRAMPTDPRRQAERKRAAGLPRPSNRCRPVGSAGGAQFRAAVPTGSGFLPPPPRTVHAVLPHTAHRRPSPPAFGHPRGLGLGRPVQRPLQFTGLVLLGGRSHRWHSPALPCARRADEVAALPITAGSVVPSARAVLRPPPTPSRLATHFPALHRL